jgi:ABC-2 type transport system permease protein
MKWGNVKAVLLQEYYFASNSLEIALDVFVFSIINVILIGFAVNYLAGVNSHAEVAQSVLIGIIFWEVIRITQYSISVSTMWNVWSRNLSNMFIAPLKTSEYLLAHIISAVLKATMIFVFSLLVARYIFHVNILALGLPVVLFSFFNMVIFAVAIALILIGLVFKYGVKIQAFTWGSIYIVQPLCGVFFPVSVLPSFLQTVARFIPISYVFEWLRALHTGAAFSRSSVAAAFMCNILFVLIGCYVFSRLLNSSKRSGQLVRNEL